MYLNGFKVRFKKTFCLIINIMLNNAEPFTVSITSL